MSKIGTTVRIPVTSHSEARAKLANALVGMNAKVSADAGSTLTLKRGSQTKMRLLGGAFIKDVDLPVLATVVFEPSTPNEIHVAVIEHVVVGSVIGMGDKYQRACTDFARRIAEAVQ
ncbi:MAG: hypothetical protein RIS55_917 [Actinomycetota bacterium]|jgi:hypothetical protein